MPVQLVVLFAFVVGALLSQPASADSPKLLKHKQNADVIAWADESEAFDGTTGDLRPQLRAFAAALNIAPPKANGDCSRGIVAAPFLHITAPKSTVEDVTGNARIAVSGRVVSLAQGFYHGFPGTLFGFRVTAKVSLREGSEYTLEPGDIRYAFIPKAKIRAPKGLICSNTAWPITIPKHGDEVLIFSYYPPSDVADSILPIEAIDHLVVQRGAARVFTPAGLDPGLRGLNIVEALEKVRRLKSNNDRAQQGHTLDLLIVSACQVEHPLIDQRQQRSEATPTASGPAHALRPKTTQ